MLQDHRVADRRPLLARLVPGQGAVRGIVIALLVVALAGGARGDAPLITADVIRFLRAGLSEPTILSELQTRGFSETLDAAREAALRDEGASETLVVAIRRAAPADRESAAPAQAPPIPAAAPPAPVVAAPSGPSFAGGTRSVRLPVSVVDKKGEPVMGLRFEDFRISDDGKRQDLTFFSGERRALRIAVALDVSDSMQNKIRQVEEALRRFIDLLEPADEIMVITFNDRVHVLQDFTSDRQQLAKVLDKLEPGGPTSLFDAAVEAIRRVAPGPAESKAVVLVTDGADTASATSFDTLLELARRSEVPVFSIGLDAAVELRDFFRQPVMPVPGGGAPRWPGGGGRGWPRGVGKRGGRPRSTGSSGAGTATFDARPLLDLAEETGGRAEIIKEFDRYAPGSPAPGSSRLKTAVESIAMTLRHRYLLGYEPPAGKRGWRTIRVDVERPATTARTRKGYYAGG